MQTLTFHLLKYKYWLDMWVKDNTTKSSDLNSIPVTRIVERNTKMTATILLCPLPMYMYINTHIYINICVYKHFVNLKYYCNFISIIAFIVYSET